jgi:hypothetical protein
MPDQTAQIKWPLSSAPGGMPQESAGRLIGCYAEPLQAESGPSQVVWRKSPGLTTFSTTGETGFRGGAMVNNNLYCAFFNKFGIVGPGGTFSEVAALAGANPTTWAHNYASPTNQIACVTENGPWLVSATGAVPWPDTNLPTSANSVSFQDGYFFFTLPDRRVFASAINGTAINALTYTQVQSRNSLTLWRGIPFNGMMWFLTDVSCEVYQNAGSAAVYPAFPYSRLTVIDRGLLGPWAVAGHQEGFGRLLWVADDCGVYQANGLQAQKVSPPDLDRLIRAVTDTTTLMAGCYTFSGHSFWTLSGPGWSWEYNLSTQKWNERWRCHAGLITTRHRCDMSVYGFNKWMMGSAVTGNIVIPDETNYSEEGDPQVFRMESGPVQDFPNRIRVARADFNFDTGTGIPSGTASQQQPQVSISWSDNGGIDWAVPVMRHLGRRNNSRNRVDVLRVGMSGAQGRRWRLQVNDAVYVGLLGGSMSADPRSH